jgi:hypothetical protein
MKTISTITCILLLLVCQPAVTQNTDYLKAINSDLWANFTKAFETLNYQLFSDLHSEHLVRVSGDSKSIKAKTEYIEGYRTRWKNKNINQTISFRFLERITDSIKASERGIYKLTINPNSANEKSYYGKFHVILIKENNRWNILVDYDSSEDNSINDKSYQDAYEITDFESFKQ